MRCQDTTLLLLFLSSTMATKMRYFQLRFTTLMSICSRDPKCSLFQTKQNSLTG